MRYTLIALFLLIPIRNAAAENNPFFAAVDMYDPSGAEQKYKGVDDVYRDLSQPSPSVLSSKAAAVTTTSHPGVGARVGLFAHRESNWEFAGSAGYILGPQITSVVNNTDITTSSVSMNGRTEVTTQAEFIRFLVEGGRRFHFTDKVTFRLGGAAGLSAGTIRRNKAVTGSANRVPARDEMQYSAGLTFELTPSVIVPMNRQELEVGARLSFIPSRGSNPTIPHFDWMPLSVFAAVRFGPEGWN